MKPIYLEPNEEITSVIERLNSISGNRVAIVVPKNSTLFQSLVNLKLLAKEAKEAGKSVVVITGNKIGQKLAREVGLPSYANLVNVRQEPETQSGRQEVTETEELPEGIKIHRYIPPSSTSEGTVGAEELPSEPKELEEMPVAEQSHQLEPPQSDIQGALEEPDESEEEHTQSNNGIPPVVTRQTGYLKAQRHPFVIPWKSIVVAAVVIIIALIVTFLMLPKATVKIAVSASPLNETIVLNAKSNSTGEENTIAANGLVVDKTTEVTITSTGKKNIGTKATGTLSIKNCEDTDTHSLKAGATVSSTGRNFSTNNAVTIPPGQFSSGGTVCNSSTVSVAITSAEAGDNYNLTNANFSIASLSGKFTAVGTTSGGTTKQVTILNQEDIDKAVADNEKQLVDQAKVELVEKASGQKLLEQTIYQTTKEKKVDKTVGSQVDSAKLNLSLSVSALVFDESQALAKLYAQMNTKLTSDQKLYLPTGNQARYTFKEYTADKSGFSFELAQDGYAIAKIEKKQVAKEITNKSVSSAEQFIKDKYKAEGVEIVLSPSWWIKRLPVISGTITVEYQVDGKIE